ncbi:MAG: RnfABCDGE type electron transport complex subunit B [Spirochaetes bacterium]|nr:RnfABCDGE type electron transport complex subunit B [Spirochaetota bacterium]
MIDTLFPSVASIITLGGLAAVFGLFLSIAMLKLRKDEDPRIEKVRDALPGADCGACGMPGCTAYATKIVEEKYAIDLCTVGGANSARKIAAIMGLDYSGEGASVTARVHCRGGLAESVRRFEYLGPKDCGAAQDIMVGFKVCEYGCLGFGDCERVCPFGAITMNDNGLPDIDREICTGCGLCVKACPRGIISLVPSGNDIHVICRNEEKAPVMKKGCSVGCIACKLCEKACRQALAEKYPEKDPAQIELAIKVDNFLARIDYDKCIQCYRCVQVCPVPVIHPLEKSKKFMESQSKKEKSQTGKTEPESAEKVEAVK